MSELPEGTFLRWIDPAPDAKPLGIVISPVSGEMISVLMTDREGDVDVEIFVARPEDTGRGASGMILDRMEVVEQGDPDLMDFLGQIGPSWWQIRAHQDGEHADQADPECLLCREAAAGTA